MEEQNVQENKQDKENNFKRCIPSVAIVFLSTLGCLIAALVAASGSKNTAMNEEMMPAVKMLIAGGLINVLLSFALGLWLAAVRKNGEDTSPMENHEWLLSGHKVSLLDGFLLFGLAFALLFADLSEQTSKIAAWMLNIGCLFQSLQGSTNYLLGVNDQMRDESLGWVFGVVQTLLNLPGLIIVAVGFFRGL